MIKLSQLWDALRTSLWFVPTLFVVGSVALAFAVIEVDDSLERGQLAGWPHLIGVGPEGSRAMLSAIASSIITVLGVTFSVTVVALSLASSQYSPRVLRNFLRDRSNQVVLGLLAGIFSYSIIVLRTIRGPGEDAFVPSLAVAGAVLLSLLGIFCLIYFIHHIATSIQASNILPSIAAETNEAVDYLFPEKMGEEGETDESEIERRFSVMEWSSVPAASTGYIQAVDSRALIGFAAANGVIVRMEHGVGEFVIESTPLVSVSTKQFDKAAFQTAIDAIFAISRHRTVPQDVGFGIRQIVDIALKALSPGINDTTTAVSCVDYLTAILVRLAPRRIEGSYRYQGTELRAIAKVPTFTDLVDLAFNQIRQNAERNPAILIRMLKSIGTVAPFVTSPERRNVLLKHVRLISDSVNRSLESDEDRQKAIEYAARTRSALERIPPGAA